MPALGDKKRHASILLRLSHRDPAGKRSRKHQTYQRAMRPPRGAPNALTFTFKYATKAAEEDNTEVLYREVAKKDIEVQTPEKRPLPGTTGPLRPPRGDGARRLRSYVCFVADIRSQTWSQHTCSVRRVSRSGR